MEELTLHREMDLIEARLRELYHTHNEAPRLIQEMAQRLPDPRGPKDSVFNRPMTHNLG